jgi:hypothetical protein
VSTSQSSRHGDYNCHVGTERGGDVTEPTDAKHREFVDSAVEQLAAMPPRLLLPSTKSVDESLARSIAKTNTRHRTIRYLASEYGLNGGPPDHADLITGIERRFAADIERIAALIPALQAEAVTAVLGNMAKEYIEKYFEDTAGLSRWLLFCAIATVPGPLAREDARDREAFQKAISEWLDSTMERYAAQYQVLIDALGRRDRVGDQLRSLTHALAMLSEGALLRAAVDTSISPEEAAEIYRQSALGLITVFTASAGDDRSVDSLIGEALKPSPTD